MTADERLFVLGLTPLQINQVSGNYMDRFDTQVSRWDDSPAQGRITLLVTTDRPWRIVGLAVASSGGRQGSFHRRIRVKFVKMTNDDRLSESGLRQIMPSTAYTSLTESIRGLATELTEARSRPIFAVLHEVIPDALEAVQNALSPLTIDARSIDRWQQEADAVRLVLRTAGIDAEFPGWRQPQRDEPFLAGLVNDPHEATLIDNDARIIPGWQAVVNSPDARPDIHVFSDGDRRIEVLNANDTQAERHLGVDLIYYLAPAKCLVLVQYKKLVQDSTPVDARFIRQIERMRRVSELSNSAVSPQDYRLGSRTSCFVKLAHSTEFDPAADSMMKGMYLPLDFLDLLMEEGALAGPNGGQSISYSNVGRHINNTLFIQLLGAGWIGSTGIGIEQVLTIAAETLQSKRSLVLAADSGRERTNLRRNSR